MRGVHEHKTMCLTSMDVQRAFDVARPRHDCGYIQGLRCALVDYRGDAGGDEGPQGGSEFRSM